MRALVSGFGRWVCVILALSTAHASEITPALSVEGTTFVLPTGNGHFLRGAELVGAELSIDAVTTVRIDGVRADPIDASGDLLLHRLSVRIGNGPWENPCEAGPDGTREAFPIPGHWDAKGRYHSDPAHFSISCTSGAQAKCLRFGYKPWKAASDGTALAPFYESCVHMVRADYCGDGEATTRNGTMIDIFDRHGIQTADGGADFHFEAGWAPSGAVCVAHTRVAENLDLKKLADQCPRLKNALGTDCSEARAVELGAMVFNRSR